MNNNTAPARLDAEAVKTLNAAGLEVSGGWLKTPTGQRWHNAIVTLSKSDRLAQALASMQMLKG
jgi:hypothetical protein